MQMDEQTQSTESNEQTQDIKRVLCIDGGGIKGVFPASFLFHLENTLKNLNQNNNIKIIDYFDLIVGTSTGGIIALALGLGLSSEKILNFYEELGPRIFNGNRLLRSLQQLLRPKYSQKELKEALESIFGDKILGDSTKRLVIPSANLANGKVYLYKTAHDTKLVTDYSEKMVEIALATSAAPTYFPIQESSSGLPLIDGGLFANNPIGIAAVEAVGFLNWQRESIRILSLGCGEEVFDGNVRGNFLRGSQYWYSKIIKTFMALQSSAALGNARVLIKSDYIIRISPILLNCPMDDPKIISDLKGLGKDEMRKNFQKVEQMFFRDPPAQPFVPYYHHNKF